MEIPHVKTVKQDAARALARGREPKKVIAAYAGLSTAMAAIVTLVSYYLGQRMSNAGGLGNLGVRSVLTTVQTVLPLLQSALMLCLELGYLNGMLRIGRGQYADHTDLKMGFRRFAPMLRMALIQMLLYCGVGMVAFYFSAQIFAFTPWAEELYTILMPVMSSTTDMLDINMGVLDDATMMQVMETMIPMLIIYVLIYGAAAIALSYRFRMARYCLLDQPQAGAFGALRQSGKLMRRNSLRLLKIDLSLWWYYLLNVLCSLICYADTLLSMAGISLPVNETVAYFLSYGAYLITLFALQYFLRNKAELHYVMAYEAICEKPKDDGVVLGNIFDM